jgi:PEP-CTERM motif
LQGKRAFFVSIEGKSMIKKSLVVVVLTVAGVGARAEVFADRASFNAATHTAYTEDFESLTFSGDFVGPTSFASGLTVDSETGYLLSAPAGFSGNTSQAIGRSGPGYSTGNDYYTEFRLGGTYTAFGADFYQNFGDGTQQWQGMAIPFAFDFMYHGYSIYSMDVDVAANTGSFIGFNTASCTMPWGHESCQFDTVRVSSWGAAYEVADNLTVGTISTVPEPQTYGLLLAGLGLMASVARRRARGQGASRITGSCESVA